MSFKLLLLIVLATPMFGEGISFRVYTWPLQGLVSEDSKIFRVPELYYLDQDDQPKRLRLARGSITRRHRYNGTRPLRLVQLAEGSEGEVLTRKFTQISVKGMEDALLVFNPDQPFSDGSPNVSLLNVHPKKVPTGKATLVNSSSRNVLVQLNGENVRLSPGQGVTRSPDHAKNGMAKMRVRLATSTTGGDLKMVFTGTLRAYKDAPNLFVIQEYGERMQVRSLRGLTGDS